MPILLSIATFAKESTESFNLSKLGILATSSNEEARFQRVAS